MKDRPTEDISTQALLTALIGEQHSSERAALIAKFINIQKGVLKEEGFPATHKEFNRLLSQRWETFKEEQQGNSGDV